MALDDDIAVLARQPLLGLLDRDALRLLAFATDRRTMRAGDILFRRGDGADGAYLVLTGSVALTAEDDGRAADEVVGPGALIGEIAMFAPVERTTTAIAREPAQLMRISRSVMRRVLGESPGSAQAIHDEIGQRLRRFAGEIAEVGAALDAIDRD